MEIQKRPQPEQEKETRVKIVDRKTLGVIDAEKIPSGYGIVSFDFEKPEFLVTNDTGDVRLFVDPSTREKSSMKLKKLEWDRNVFLSALGDLPPDYRDTLEKLEMPDEFYVTKSPEGTELVHAIGKGTPEEPLEIIQRSTHVYRDISLVHLAIIKYVSITQKPITVLLNKVLFTYTPQESEVTIDASTSFQPPREFDKIDSDLRAGKPISYIDYSYHNWLTNNPDTFKDPAQWYREDYYGYGLKMAKAMIEKVKERIYKKDL